MPVQQLLMSLIERLENSSTASLSKEIQVSALSGQKIQNEEEAHPDYAIQINDIHPKESELFEVIHVRYLRFFQSKIKE